MDKEINDKISRCKALQGQTVLDIINSDKFRDNLAGYWTAQKEDRKAIKSSYAAMNKVGGIKGYKLPAHPIDKLFDCDVEQMRDEYTKVVAKVSTLPAAQRAYIWQLGQQAYALTVAQIVCEEFPELRDKLIPKIKTN